MKIAILGAGAWGTALALGLAQRHQVLLWGRDVAAMQAIDTERENRAYLPGMQLPPALQVTASLESAVAHLDAASSLLIIATPVAGLRPLCMQLQQCRDRGQAVPNLVWLCKGFEEGSSLLPHQVVQSVLGATLPGTLALAGSVPGNSSSGTSLPGTAAAQRSIAVGVLSGPSFAQEVARGLPCALTIASDDAALRQQVVTAFHSGMLRIYASDDVTGVEVGGAVKNIMAIATGVIDGMGFGANARAALITRGLAEITRLGVALGGRAETFMGLAGIGDLLLTCTGELSRNRQVGLGLAQGKPLARIVDELGHVAEGVRCAQAVCALAAARGVDMPITAAVVDVLFNGDSADAMVTRLLSRDPRVEAV